MKTQTIRIPLLHDHHTHPLLYASFGAAVCLESVTQKAVANQMLNSASAGGKSELLLAYGWRSNRFRWTDEELNSFGPMAIFNLSLHELLLNQAGRELLRAKIGDDVDRVSDQIWYENHFRQVLNWFANLNPSAESLRGFYEDLEQLGIGSAEELLLVDEREIELFKEADLLERTCFWSAPDTFETLSTAAQSQVTGMKLFTDGALGAKTAALSKGYLADPAQLGMLVYTDQELASNVSHCLGNKSRLAVHAIGDTAIGQIIGILENEPLVQDAEEIRIEHAQMIDLETAHRAKALGVKLSMQPNFSSDSIHYADRMSLVYCEMNNPFRMLVDKVGFVPGEDLLFGSDGMPHGIEAAARQCFFSPLESQRVSIDEFVAAYGGLREADFELSKVLEMSVTKDDVKVRVMDKK